MPKTLYIKRGTHQYRIKQHQRALAIEREQSTDATNAPVQMFAVTAYQGGIWNLSLLNTLLDQYESIQPATVSKTKGNTKTQ